MFKFNTIIINNWPETVYYIFGIGLLDLYISFITIKLSQNKTKYIQPTRNFINP